MESRRNRHALRKTLFENGFDPLPNKSKLCVMENWSKVEITEDTLDSKPYQDYRDTGIRCGEVVALDLDIDDVELLDQLADELFYAGIPGSEFVRIGRPPREMWIYVTDDKVSKMTTGKFGRNLDAETGEYGEVYQVEILGHGSQFGAYGRHSKGIEYEWPEKDLLNHGIDELPVVTKEDLENIIATAEQFFESEGFSRVSKGLNQIAGFDHSYDLKPDMIVTTRDHGDMTIASIARKLEGTPDASWRCCMDFIRDDTDADTTGLISFLDGDVTITDFATGITHFPAEHNIEDAIAALAGYMKEMGIEVAQKRKARLVGDPMSPHEDLEESLIKALDRYVYVNTDDRVVDKYDPRVLMTLTGFRNFAAPYNAEETGPRGGPKRVYLSELWRDHAQRLNAKDAVFRPDMPQPMFREGDLNYVNTYQTMKFPKANGEARTGFRFLMHLLPDDAERRFFIQWLSYKLQHPHVRGPAIVMVADRTYGTGRGTLFRLIKRMMGGRYTYKIDFKTLSGGTSQSQYNEWLENNLIVAVDEAQEIRGGKWKTGHDTYEHLKTIIDPGDSNVHIVRKGLSNRESQVFASIMIFTNHMDALVIPADDRRIAVLENGEKGSPAFWEEINKWMSIPGNVGAFTDAVLSYDLAGYSPSEDPIMTDMKRQMIEQSESDLDEVFKDFAENCKGDVACYQQLENYVYQRLEEEDLSLPDDWDRPLKGIFKRGTRAPKQDNRIKVGNKQYRYRVLRNFDAVNKHSTRKISSELKKNGAITAGYEPEGMSNVIDMTAKKTHP